MNYSEPSIWPIGKAPASDFCSEDDRLAVLGSYGMDELDGDEELARIARFAARLCNAPIALVSIVEQERQCFLAREGIEATKTPREWSFCAHAMLGSEAFIVPDARAHPTFAENPLVTGEPFIRFYAGIPLISPEGSPLGSLCVIDTDPREGGLDDLQREGLEVLASSARRRLDAHRDANQAVAEIAQSVQRVQFVLDSVPDIAWSAAPGPEFDYFNARWQLVTGLEPPRSVDDWRMAIHPDDYDATVAKFTAAIERCELFEDQWRLRQIDGSYRWILSRAVPSTRDPGTARWYGTITDIDDAHRISQEREILAGELAHRIKNIFTVIIGLITLHSRGDRTMKAFGDLISDHIRALARAQEFALQLGNETEDRLDKLLAVLMAPYRTAGKSRVTITGEAVRIGKRATTPLALTFHELATNSAKYGALSAAEGAVTIAISQEDGTVTITWTESGGPQVEPPSDSGFGSRLLQMSVEGQLGGEIEQDWKTDGLRATIRIPADRLAK